jgi:hypothetical protein
MSSSIPGNPPIFPDCPSPTPPVNDTAEKNAQSISDISMNMPNCVTEDKLSTEKIKVTFAIKVDNEVQTSKSSGCQPFSALIQSYGQTTNNVKCLFLTQSDTAQSISSVIQRMNIIMRDCDIYCDNVTFTNSSTFNQQLIQSVESNFEGIMVDTLISGIENSAQLTVDMLSEGFGTIAGPQYLNAVTTEISNQSIQALVSETVTSLIQSVTITQTINVLFLKMRIHNCKLMQFRNDTVMDLATEQLVQDSFRSIMGSTSVQLALTSLITETKTQYKGPENSSDGFNWGLFFFIILIILAILAGVWYFKNNKKAKAAKKVLT